MCTPRPAGTYALLVRLDSDTDLEVGRIGRIQFRAGDHAYIGSALGSGGLAARLRRYSVGPPRLHWHIDYVLEHAEVVGALVREDSVRLECTWAKWFSVRCETEVEGFGSSDCRCASHLFLLGGHEAAEQILETAGLQLKAQFVERTLLTGEP
jgi:sugar fermentation stimulation protein A